MADAIRANPSFQGLGGQFSQPQYLLFLAQQGFSAAGFEELTRTVLSQQVLAETAEAAILPAPGTGARIAAYRGESRGVTMLSLTLGMAPDPGPPDEGALRAFYEANAPMFTEPERRWGEYLHSDSARLRAAPPPAEATPRAAHQADLQACHGADNRAHAPHHAPHQINPILQNHYPQTPPNTQARYRSLPRQPPEIKLSCLCHTLTAQRQSVYSTPLFFYTLLPTPH